MNRKSLTEFLSDVTRVKGVQLSSDETQAIDNDINRKMEEVNMEFKYRNAKSIEWAKRTYFTF